MRMISKRDLNKLRGLKVKLIDDFDQYENEHI